MLVTKATRDPSGEKLGELANPTFAIKATERSTSSSATAFLAATIKEAKTSANASVEAKMIRSFRVIGKATFARCTELSR
jgi:hypothetical protein